MAGIESLDATVFSSGVGPNQNGPPREPRKRLSVFVAAYNEVQGLAPTVRGILAAADVELEGCQVLIVDDGSTDGTGAVADRLASEDPRVMAFHHPRNLGLRAGFETALAHATMEYFTLLPGDNEVDPASIRMIFQNVGAAEIVIPYHYNQWDRPWYRQVLTFVFTTTLNLLLGNRVKYYQGPNVYPTRLAQALPRSSQGFFFMAEMTALAVHCGYGTMHIGLIHKEREGGRSTALSSKNIRRALSGLIGLWWRLKVSRTPVILPPHVAPARKSLSRVPDRPRTVRSPIPADPAHP